MPPDSTGAGSVRGPIVVAGVMRSSLNNCSITVSPLSSEPVRFGTRGDGMPHTMHHTGHGGSYPVRAEPYRYPECFPPPQPTAPSQTAGSSTHASILGRNLGNNHAISRRHTYHRWGADGPRNGRSDLLGRSRTGALVRAAQMVDRGTSGLSRPRRRHGGPGSLAAAGPFGQGSWTTAHSRHCPP